MSMAGVVAARAPDLCSSSYFQHQLNSTSQKSFARTKYCSFLENPHCLLSSNTRLKKFAPVQASSSQREEEEEETNDNSTNGDGLSQGDWNYLLKLGAGSIAGATVIKYGSILFPEITRPNILQALIMISTPVILAILLLIKQSRQQ